MPKFNLRSKPFAGRRAIVAALAGLCAFAAPAQPAGSALNAGLEREYTELIRLDLADGMPCSSKSAQTNRKQQDLARLVRAATPRTVPRALLFAVAANSLDDVRRLAAAGASRAGDNGSLLHVAARYSDPPMLEYLTSIGLRVDELGGAGGPALIVAVTSARLDNAVWLIEHGADVNATDRAGGSVLRHALVCRDQSLVDFLLRSGAMADATTRELAGRLGLRL